MLCCAFMSQMVVSEAAKISKLSVCFLLPGRKSNFLFEILDQCDTHSVSPSIYDAISVCSAIRHLYCGVLLCAVQEKHSYSTANKPGRPIRGLDWQDDEEGWTALKEGDLYENPGWVPSSLSSPRKNRPTKHTHTLMCTQITLPSAEAEIHVRIHRVPLPCNNCSTLSDT